MKPQESSAVKCAICGIQADYHAHWFLVTGNRWFDQLRVFFWHPFLAMRSGVVGVCGKRHLRDLIVHWLTEANLSMEDSNQLAYVDNMPDSAIQGFCGFVGELAVHRETLSGSWTGSAEMLAVILRALVGVPEIPAEAQDYFLHSLQSNFVPDSIVQ